MQIIDTINQQCLFPKWAIECLVKTSARLLTHLSLVVLGESSCVLINRCSM